MNLVCVICVMGDTNKECVIMHQDIKIEHKMLN